MVKSDSIWVDSKCILSIIALIVIVIKYGGSNAPRSGEVHECIDNMLGQMKATLPNK